MIAFPNEHTFNRAMAELPSALRERKAEEIFEQAGNHYCIKPVGHGPGYIIVDIRNSGGAADVIAWCHAVDICAVNIQPQDVQFLYGDTNFAVMMCVKALEQGDPNVTARLSNLEPDELFTTLVDTINALASASPGERLPYATEEEQELLDTALLEQDLAKFGLPRLPEDRRYLLDPKPEPERYVSDEFLGNFPKPYRTPEQRAEEATLQAEIDDLRGK
jgi:hypothetical protein